MKKRFLSILVILALCLCILPMGVFASETENASESPTYLALGDSITTGYGLANADTSGFASQTAAELGFDLVNAAVDGGTSESLLAQLNTGELDQTIAKAKLITITCGGNDLMNVLYSELTNTHNAANGTNYTVDEIKAMLTGSGALSLLGTANTVLNGLISSTAFQTALGNYAANMFGATGVIAKLRALNPDASIIVATQYNPYKSFTGLFATIGNNIDLGAQALNTVIRQAQKSQPNIFTVSDVYGAFAAVSENLCNASAGMAGFSVQLELDFHPNAAGHTVMADTIVRTYHSLSFGFAGHQIGENGIRFVGYVNDLSYDSVDLLITVEDTEKTFTMPTQNVFKTLLGTVNGETVPVASCDPSIDALHKLSYDYLYGYAITGIDPGSYTFTVQPIAHIGEKALMATACTLTVTVTEDGTITAI